MVRSSMLRAPITATRIPFRSMSTNPFWPLASDDEGGRSIDRLDAARRQAEIRRLLLERGRGIGAEPGAGPLDGDPHPRPDVVKDDFPLGRPSVGRRGRKPDIGHVGRVRQRHVRHGDTEPR